MLFYFFKFIFCGTAHTAVTAHVYVMSVHHNDVGAAYDSTSPAPVGQKVLGRIEDPKATAE